jgi:CRISPR-associated protein Cas5d
MKGESMNENLEPYRYRVRIRGPMACFTRPEFKTERVSYEIITPSAARGVIEAVLWKPAIRWHVLRIALLSEPRYVQVKRNELNEVCSTFNVRKAMRGGTMPDYFADEDRAQRNTLALRDVDYAVEVGFEMTGRQGPDDNPHKFDEMFRRRLEKGQCHMQPYLGCREFPALVEPYSGDPPPILRSKPLGLMLHDIQFGADANRPVFFDAALRDGVVEVPAWEETS